MAGIQQVGFTAANVAEVDANRNAKASEGYPAHPAAGGYYTVCGGPAAVVAAALATDVSLISLRFSPSSTRQAYLHKFRFNMSPSTLGAAAGVAGRVALQRITTATPSGGVARTPNEQNPALATLSDMTDIRDNNAALTVTSVVFGAEIASSRIPLFVSSAGWYEWIYEPIYPTVFAAGDGMVMRTRVALAATQTWVFDWTAHWFEGPVIA
jgi:hypothetical protein